MYGLNPEASVAELDYRRERIAQDYRHAAATARAVRWHLHRRGNRQRVS